MIFCFPIGKRRHAIALLEQNAEIVRIRYADCAADLIQFHVRCLQKISGVGKTNFGDVLPYRHSGFSFEDCRIIIRRDPKMVCDRCNREIAVVKLFRNETQSLLYSAVEAPEIRKDTPDDFQRISAVTCGTFSVPPSSGPSSIFLLFS